MQQFLPSMRIAGTTTMGVPAGVSRPAPQVSCVRSSAQGYTMPATSTVLPQTSAVASSMLGAPRSAAGAPSCSSVASCAGVTGFCNGGMMMGDPMMGGQIVEAPQFAAPQSVSMDDLPFSSIGHKAMWTGIFDMVQQEVEAFQKTQKTNPTAQSKTPRIPMPNIPDQQIEMIFDSYDMEKSGILDSDKIKALMRDLQCVNCVAMSNQKGESMQEARKELTTMMGPQAAMMMSADMSQMMDFELQTAKQIALQEVTDEECAGLFKDLDLDQDGQVSKADFLANAKKCLFDPNPPEEMMQALEAMEAAVNSGPCMVVDSMPMCGVIGGAAGLPMIGGCGAPVAIDSLAGEARHGGMFMQASQKSATIPKLSAVPPAASTQTMFGGSNKPMPQFISQRIPSGASATTAEARRYRAGSPPPPALQRHATAGSSSFAAAPKPSAARRGVSRPARGQVSMPQAQAKVLSGGIAGMSTRQSTSYPSCGIRTLPMAQATSGNPLLSSIPPTSQVRGNLLSANAGIII